MNIEIGDTVLVPEDAIVGGIIFRVVSFPFFTTTPWSHLVSMSGNLECTRPTASLVKHET